MNYGYSIETGSDIVDSLMNRGGIQSMRWTLSPRYLGLSYGGILEKAAFRKSFWRRGRIGSCVESFFGNFFDLFKKGVDIHVKSAYNIYCCD